MIKEKCRKVLLLVFFVIYRSEETNSTELLFLLNYYFLIPPIIMGSIRMQPQEQRSVAKYSHLNVCGKLISTHSSFNHLITMNYCNNLIKSVREVSCEEDKRYFVVSVVPGSLARIAVIYNMQIKLRYVAILLLRPLQCRQASKQRLLMHNGMKLSEG